MSRTGITVALLILLGGMLVVALAMNAKQREQFLDGFFHRSSGRDSALGQNSQSGTVYAVATRQPMPDSLAHLQFLADAVRCPVSDRSAIMASCVAQRYQKMRDKALSARARYDALVGLERAYWAALAREGLTQRVEHIPVRP